tara:strand:- start:43 stop:414 length:372 start_codon:yes stop_codon:yes gene_type:complete
MKYLKTIFFIFNFSLIIFYLYPGSIFGCFFFEDCLKQPVLTRDFIISSNHFYTFFLLSIFGYFAYQNKKKKIFIYLFLISIILELFHLFIPNRSFQFSDLFGNMFGILIFLAILNLINFWKKK